jgi:hypothetical protein
MEWNQPAEMACWFGPIALLQVYFMTTANYDVHLMKAGQQVQSGNGPNSGFGLKPAHKEILDISVLQPGRQCQSKSG